MKQSLFEIVVTHPATKDKWIGFIIFWWLIILDFFSVGFIVLAFYVFNEMTIASVLISVVWLFSVHWRLW